MKFNFRSFALIIAALASVFTLSGSLRAQDISVAASVAHDQNIFNIYDQTSDDIAQFDLEASKDWDAGQTSLGLAYAGSILFFRGLTSRNYHSHFVTFNATYQFEPPEEEQDESESGGDSAKAAAPIIPAEVQPDSSCRFLYALITGASQFDKEDFSEYDNTLASGTFIFRQPLGKGGSIRPIYTLSYHSYPNLSAVTNIQNIFAVQFGADIPYGGKITLIPAYAVKSYPVASSVTYTVGTQTSTGHGKSGAHGGLIKRTITFDLSSAPAKQFSFTLNWKQKIWKNTEMEARYSYHGEPSTGARVIPLQLGGSASEIQVFAGDFGKENEIFDDNFSYSDNEINLNAEQQLPVGFSLKFSGEFQKKSYTYAAMDLQDSLALAGNRLDDRLELKLNISKMFGLGGGKHLKPQAEVLYLRNKSNAPYYDFEKSTYLIRLEYSF